MRLSELSASVMLAPLIPILGYTVIEPTLHWANDAVVAMNAIKAIRNNFFILCFFNR